MSLRLLKLCLRLRQNGVVDSQMVFGWSLAGVGSRTAYIAVVLYHPFGEKMLEIIIIIIWIRLA